MKKSCSLFKGNRNAAMNKHERKTKPELWEQIEQLEQNLTYMERFLDEKGLYEEACEYIMKCILDREDLPFD